jgi:hypothetical protein
VSGSLSVLRRYVSTLYTVRGVCVDADAGDQPQDSHIDASEIKPGSLAETDPPPDEVSFNVLSATGIGQRGLTRPLSLFSLFLDGTRRTNLVAEMETAGKRLLPILGGQVCSAVIYRDRGTGSISTYRYRCRRLMIVPAGGRGMNEGDVRDLAADLQSRGGGIEVESYRIRRGQDPRDSGIAKANALMQRLEIDALEELTNQRLLDQRNILVVDGSVQFENIAAENQFWLRHVVGVAKTFKRDLSFLKDGTEVGVMLARDLRRLGDRTAAFRLKKDEDHQYAIWYLRIRENRHLDYPLAGIVKVEKLLVTDEERERGLSSDAVNNLSASLVGERYVTPYGKDTRWANHLYPIYLAEVLQHSNMMSDHHFLRLF